MKRLRRKIVKIMRKPRRAISILDRAKRSLEFAKEGMRLAISC